MKNYKLKLVALIGLCSMVGFLSSCGEDHEHDDDHKHDHEEGSHAGHDHGDHEGHDHGDHEGHDHGEHEGHDHHEKQAGPNGGRVITSVEPHLEFFAMKDGKIQISFLNDENNVIAPVSQEVSVIGGDRSSPTRLKFEKKGNVLISDKALPSENNLPIILQIKVTPELQTIREKFNLNLTDCPTCVYKEYACTCDHSGDNHDHDHDHKH